MTTVLIVVGAVLAFVLLFFAAVALSARRQGRLARSVLGAVMRTSAGQKMAMRATDRLLGTDGSFSAADIERVMAEQPELIDQMAAEQGVDPAQARQALAQFAKMNSSQRDLLVSRAQDAVDSGETDATKIAAELAPELGQVKTRTSTDARAAAKKKAAARAKRKNAKRHRGR